MTRSIFKGYKTQPLKVGAPLPGSLTALPLPPTQEEIEDELDRAEVELMYAAARHRQAWALMRKRQKEREEAADVPGALAALESDPIWKKRTTDVTWWRGEVDMQASLVLALGQMRDRRLAVPPAHVAPTTVFGWRIDGSQGPPTDAQYSMASQHWSWLDTQNKPGLEGERAAVNLLLQAYRGAYAPPG